MSTKCLAPLLATASMLTACVVPPPGDVPPPAVAPAPATAPPPPLVEPATVAPPLPSGPVSAASAESARRMSLAAVELLEGGNEEQAKAEVQRALSADPNNKLAQSLLKQITADPVATLGRESFNYTVRSSDTLSRIAGRFLGDIYQFYILARYNDIKVPRQVSGGQVLRIPGQQPPRLDPPPASPTPPDRHTAPPSNPPPPAPTLPPPPPPVAEPTPGEKALSAGVAAERAGDLRLALAQYRLAAAAQQAGAAAKVESVRNLLIKLYTQRARSTFARQDLDGAIQNWDRVLELDAANETARFERAKALGLKEKLKAIK